MYTCKHILFFLLYKQSFLFLFKDLKQLIAFIYVCVCECEYVGTNIIFIRMEVRGQLVGISISLLRVGPGDWTQMPSLGDKHLSHLSHLTDPVDLYASSGSWTLHAGLK